MATNMNPDVLKYFQDQMAFHTPGGGYGEVGGLGPQLNADGNYYYQPIFNQRAYGSGEEASMLLDPSKIDGYMGYDASWADGGDHKGETGQVYKPDGAYSHDYAWMDDNWKENFTTFLIAALTMGMGIPALQGAGAGGGAAAGGATGFGSGSLASGAGIGSGAGSSFFGTGLGTSGLGTISPWGFTGGAGLEGLLAGAGAAGGAAGAIGAGGGGSGAAGTGAATGATGASSASSTSGGGFLSNLFGGGNGAGSLGGSNWLGLGSTLLGGILGGKGQENEQTQQQQWDSRLDPYLFGEGGLFGLTQQAMQRSQSPERLAEAARIRQMGMGLLGRPVARNPFGGY